MLKKAALIVHELIRNWRLLISANVINQTSKRQHEKEHARISNTAKFQSDRPKETREIGDI